jgi:hypothetical protein
MVEEILVKEQLTKEMMEAGATLIARLVQSGLPINVAMWLFTLETNKWRLLISTPLAEDHPGDVRRRIEEARQSLDPEAAQALYWAVSLIGTHDELVQAILASMPVGPSAKPVRLTRSAVRGRYIDDALVYRSAEAA